MTVTEVALTWTKFTAKEPDMPLVYSRPSWWDQWRNLLKNQWYGMAKIFNTMSFPSKCRKSPSGVFLERYRRFEISEVECQRETGRCWQAQEVSSLWAAVLWPSSCAGCAACPTCLTSRQKIICKGSLIAVEYRHSSCRLNKKKQYRARLLAILKENISDQKRFQSPEHSN